jgi:hypothetical protein
VLAIFDKPDALEGPFFEETIYVTPSRLTAMQQAAIHKCAQESTRAVGLTHGPVHAEFRIGVDAEGKDEVWPLEVAARPIGGLCARALRFVASGETGQKDTGARIGLEELLLRQALGEPVEWEREQGASGVMMIPVPSSGVLEKIEGQDAARAIRDISDLIITARLHDYIQAWPEGASYLGFLFGRAETPEAVEQALRSAHAKLRFTLTERLPVQHPLQTGESA